MLHAIRYYLRLLALPLLFMGLFGTLFLAWRLFDLPPPEVLVAMIERLFATYGMPVLLLSALVEGMLLVGNYFPGIFVIFLGVLVADTVGEAARAVAVVTVGLFAAHLANYALGRYGWYRLLTRFGFATALDRARARLLARGSAAIYASYWLPNLGALTDTAAGIIKMPFLRFTRHALIATVFWNVVVAVLVYTFRDAALVIATPGGSGMMLVFGVLALWAAVLVVSDRRERRRVEDG